LASLELRRFLRIPKKVLLKTQRISIAVGLLAMLRKARSGSALLCAGLGPQDIDVIELHDCFSANELITYEALGLCPEGNVRLITAEQ